jgi:Fe-S cluster assembly protein SufB
MNEDNNNIIPEVIENEYKFGFTTEIEMDYFSKGLSEETVRKISKIKNEPEFMLEFRLRAFRKWQQMKHPIWPHLDIPKIDFQDIIYYAAPKKNNQLSSLDEVDP